MFRFLYTTTESLMYLVEKLIVFIEFLFDKIDSRNSQKLDIFDIFPCFRLIINHHNCGAYFPHNISSEKEAKI